MAEILLAAEEHGAAPNRAEVKVAQEHGLLTRIAIVNLQHDVYRWSIRHFEALSPEAMRDLYETIGVRRKA